MRRKTALFILILSLLLLVLPNGRYSAFDPDEPKYLEAAYEMVKTGNYVIPKYNYTYRFDKPILTYWLIALGYKIFGVNEFGGRFFISLTGVFSILLLYLWLLELRKEKLALWASLVLLVSLDFVIMASLAMPDVPLMFFIEATLIFLHLGYSREKKKKFFYILAFFFSALAVLTKGPVGFVLPAFVFTVYLILKRDFLKTLREIPWGFGIAVFLVVSLPWYVAVYQRVGYQFFRDFILFHNIHRFFGKIPHHPTHWWFYLANFPWLYLPWSVIFIFAVFRFLKEKEFISDDLMLFSFSWFFGTFIFFQIAKTKLPHYLLPSFPAFAVITASYVLKLKEKLPYVLTFLTAVLLQIALFVFLRLKGFPPQLSLVLAPFVIGSFISIFSKHSYKELFLGFFLSLLLFKWWALPSIEPYRAKVAAGNFLRSYILSHKNLRDKVYTFKIISPVIVWKYRLGKVQKLSVKQINSLIASKKAVIVTKQNRLRYIKNKRFKIIFRKKDYITGRTIIIIRSG